LHAVCTGRAYVRPVLARSRLLVVAGLAAPPLIAAAGWLIFLVLKEAPTHASCPEDARWAADYRRGLGTLGSLSAVALMALILSVRPPGPKTVAALSGAWLAVVVFNYDNDVFEEYAMAAFSAAVLGGELVYVLSAIAAAVAMNQTALLTHLWVSLLVFLPTGVMLLAAQGEVWACVD
jgi:hypothetical protein